jgi:hypothetical protein
VAKIGDPSNDISFDADLVEQFLEYAETPLTKIKQRGPKKSSKHKVRDVRRTDPGASASKPLMHFLTTPGCGACNRLKAAVNKGAKARQLFPQFDIVYLNGPRGPWYDKWYELGHENYVPQTYFYSREGRHLNVIGPFGEQYAHSFMTEDALVAGMQEALERDRRIAAGEEYKVVLGLKPPPPPPPSPPQEQGPASYDDCASCISQGFGWSLKKHRCGGFKNRRCPEL